MTTFDERENAFEAKFALDSELQFKAEARRNKLIGLWAADLLGIEGEKAKDYALDVIRSDFEEPGDDNVLRKLTADFETQSQRKQNQVSTLGFHDQSQRAIAR